MKRRLATIALFAWVTALAHAANVPGTATVVINPYGPLSVQGATLVGNTISNFSSDAVIQLGSIPGSPSVAAQIDFQGLGVGPGATLTIRPGAPDQIVFLVDTSPDPSVIAGILGAQNFGPDPPVLYIRNKNGITIVPGGVIAGQSGVTVDALGATWTEGQAIVNNGVIDAGVRMELDAASITGSGEFRGNSIVIRTFGNANNPVHGAFFLQNGVLLIPSANNPTSTVALTLNAYGNAPQVLNFQFFVNGTVWMPSSWPAGSTVPVNNQVVPLGGTRPSSVPDPAYGGGSMIVQATGSLALVNGGTNDFVFPGGIVLKAGGDLDLNAVAVDNGWTTSGQPFQGVFLESPNIVSPGGNIRVLTNKFNWVNFSTLPYAPVRTWTLISLLDGTAVYATADATAPHLNTYSTLVNTAAIGGCWTCLLNPQPVNMSGGE